ncbi:4-(cytidine 5'-diphospho)-2-C-methyl-D-erythritol kinase [Alsobacter sp. R-9]
MLRDRAPAKVNLTLHVLGRRNDGFHDLLSLVAFAGVGDGLVLEAGRSLAVKVEGPTAAQAGPDDDNLVLRAAHHLAALVPGLVAGRFRLTKRLPVAAGLGGGSSDAAAALRLLARANGLPPDDPRLAEAARRTGSDVPVCLAPRARVMAGTGHEVGPPVPLDPLFALLVNPRVAVPTPAVFRGLALAPGQAGPSAGFTAPSDPTAWANEGRNDLEPPAIATAPAVADVLLALRGLPGCRLARMSGSGATCFALFPDCHAAARAARALRALHPDWWISPTVLR